MCPSIHPEDPHRPHSLHKAAELLLKLFLRDRHQFRLQFHKAYCLTDTYRKLSLVNSSYIRWRPFLNAMHPLRYIMQFLVTLNQPLL